MATTIFLDSVSALLRQDNLPYTVVGGLAVIVLISWLSYLNDPLRSIPGPFWARWGPAWLVYWARDGTMHRKMISMHQKYGKLVRTAPNEVSFSNPEYLKVVYGAGSDFHKSDWYSVWQGRRKWDLFGERSEAVHRSQRRLVSQIYSLSNMKKLEPYVDTATKLFLQKLRNMSGKKINMTQWAQLYAFDVIGEVTFSKTFGFLEAGEDIHGAFTLIDNSLRSAAWVGYVPWVYWANVRLAPVIGNRLGVLGRQNGLLTFAAKAIKERKERGTDHHDVLDQLFQVQKEKPELDDICITSMVASNIFAGSDSTSISLSAFIYHLIKNPQYKEKLVTEIDEVAKAHNIKHGDIFPIDISNDMPYLQACLQEALRCHPAVGMNLGRVVPPQGIELDGTYIPGGTVVGANAWVVHQHKETFGDDADKFRPDRWLEEPERVSEMKRAFFSFGAGSRFCIGKNIAMLELAKVTPSLFHDFDFELVDPQAKMKEFAMSFVKIDGLQVTVSPRKVLN